jgi:hypothetical protein
MPNAKDAVGDSVAFRRILVVGKTGSGKSAQIWTLPGKKFAYIFDPNTLATVQGSDVDYETFYPDFLEMDATLKGFNKGSKSDKLPQASKREPNTYMKWVEDMNAKVEAGFFKDYQWIIFDSLTFLVKATMDRQLYINGRYGDIEELGDYRIVGSKLSDVFNSIVSLPINIYATGHLSTFQDEKTKKIETQLLLPGKARNMFPLMFTDIWLAYIEEGEKGATRYNIRTIPDSRGLQDIRTSLKGLKAVEDVTINKFDPDSTRYGIGALLQRSR